jgi:hypothetical protein
LSSHRFPADREIRLFREIVPAVRYKTCPETPCAAYCGLFSAKAALSSSAGVSPLSSSATTFAKKSPQSAAQEILGQVPTALSFNSENSLAYGGNKPRRRFVWYYIILFSVCK